GEGVQLVHHRVDGVFEFEDFAANVHGDFTREVAAGDGGGNFGDVADLGSEVVGHRIDVIGQIFPSAGDAFDFGLAAELAFGADLARGRAYVLGEGVQLVHHGVDGVFEFEDFAFDIDGNFAGQVAASHGGGDLGDIADLGGEVAGHGIDVVGQVFPGPGDPGDDGLATEFALGADFAGDAGDFGGERPKLLDHGVDGFFELENLAVDVHGDLAGKVAIGPRDGHFGDVADLGGEIAGHLVDALGQFLPDAADAADPRMAAEFAFGADFAGDAGDFGGEHAELFDHLVDDLGAAEELALERAAVDLEGHGLGEVA